MRPLILIGTACLVCGLEPVASHARQPAIPAYPTVVAAYREGRLGAVDVLLALPEREVAIGVDQAINPPGDRQPWAWEDLRGAALLHTDAWYTDLRHKRMGAANVQLEFAQKLLEHVVALEPTQADYAQRWYAVVAQFLRRLGTPLQLQSFLGGRTRFPMEVAREKALPHFTRGLVAEYPGREAKGGRSRRPSSPGPSRSTVPITLRPFTSGVSGCFRQAGLKPRRCSRAPFVHTIRGLCTCHRSSWAAWRSAMAGTTKQNDYIGMRANVTLPDKPRLWH